MDSMVNRFFVLEGSDIPNEVRAELEAYRFGRLSSADTRGVVGDFIVAVLGGLASAGIWDQLPLWAAWLSASGAAFRRADAKEVADNVVSLCIQAGLATRKSDITVDQLVKIAQAGWSGRASVGTTLVSFRADGRGQIVVFDSVSTGTTVT